MAADRATRCSSRPAAKKEGAERRLARVIFQRRCPEQQALRRANLAEIASRAHAPQADKSYPITAKLQDEGGVFGVFEVATPGLGIERRNESKASAASFVPAAAGQTEQLPETGVVPEPLTFSSAFESANLLSAKRVEWEGLPPEADVAADLEYELYLDGDTQSGAVNTQWFHFGVRVGDFTGLVHFRIVNMKKKKSLFQCGMQPYVYSTSNQARGWEPFACRDVCYTLNSGCPRAKSSGGTIHMEQSTLAFSYRFGAPGDELCFAAYRPYTYTMLNDFLYQIEEHAEARRNFCCYELCRSIGQLPIPLLVITDDIRRRSNEDNREGGSQQSIASRLKAAKPAVMVIARQHPGEVVGSWTAQGLLRFLLGPTPAAQSLRRSYVFHVVPMVNVDGVVHGNSRCNLSGYDPNRCWADPNPIIHPEVFTVKKYMSDLVSGVATWGGYCKQIDLFLDFHGHSAAFGCFFYGSCPKSPISAALFPKLCALTSQDICFDRCHWRCPRSHRGSARYIVYKHLGVKQAFTMETSFFCPSSEGLCKLF